MFELLLGLSVLFVLIGLLLLKVTIGAQRMSINETSTSGVRHLVQSGSKRCHGMVSNNDGFIRPDSKTSNSFLGIFF